MKLKATLIGTALTLLTLPLIANAELITENNTNEWSSVRITSQGNRCSGLAHDDTGITKPGQTTTTSTNDVKSLCSKTPCKAEILMATDYNSAKNCNGSAVAIGTAEIDDFNTDYVTNLAIYTNYQSKYDASYGSKANHIILNYAK